jgi:hypothetical protein
VFKKVTFIVLITRANILLMAAEDETDSAMPTAGYAYADRVRVLEFMLQQYSGHEKNLSLVD